MRDSASFRQPEIFAGFLIALSLWTLSIKFGLPMTLSFLQELAIFQYVLWDFWWLAHLGLAALLWSRRRWSLAAAWIISILEVFIVLIKLGAFLKNPEWSILNVLWFQNKLAVLGVFLCLIFSLVFYKNRWKDAVS